MIPGVGFIFDGINAVWYATEGDWFNAASSFVSALPGVGDAFGAFAKGGKACKLVTAFHKAGAAGNLILGAYTFGNIGAKYMFGDGDFTADEVLEDLFTVAMTGASMWGSAKDFGNSYCFVAGTLVTTEDGFKPIEEIEVGDRVLSENEQTGEIDFKEVYATSVSETDEFYHIHVNGEEIVATGTHPFYVYKFGWTTARALRAGDVLVLSNGELITVEWIDHEILESPINVYNFEGGADLDSDRVFVGALNIRLYSVGIDHFSTFVKDRITRFTGVFCVIEIFKSANLRPCIRPRFTDTVECFSGHYSCRRIADFCLKSSPF